MTKKEIIDELYALERAKKTVRVTSDYDIIPLLLKYAKKPTEHFFCITLNGAHEVIKVHIVTQGLVNRTIVHPREVFRAAIQDNAAAIIIAHNHPSGNFEPSEDDKSITHRMVAAGEVIGIRVLDHIVFGAKGHYSALSSGELT